MLRILSAAAVVILAVTFDLRPARAYEMPWCAVISLGDGDDHWDCQYASLEACRPNVLAGNRGFCNHNPRYAGPEPRPRMAYSARGRRHHARRH